MDVVDLAAGPMRLQVVESTDAFEEMELTVEVQEALRILPGRREVYRAEIHAPRQSIVAKRFLRHVKQARDWRREWDGLIKLTELGLSAPTPVCVAEESETGAIWVVMQQIEGAASVQEAFARADPEERSELAQQLAGLVDATHRAGARQTDQHIDNWAWDGARLYLLDAGSFEFTRHTLGARARLQDLAAICVTLAPAAEMAFRAALDGEYLVDDTDLKGRLLYELDGEVVALQRARTRRYFKKTRRTCTEFVETQTDRYHSLHLRTADSEVVDALLADPERLMEEGERVKSGNTCTVQRITRGGQSYILKRYNKKPLADRIRKLFADSRALTSWSSAWVLEMAFVPTARAIAVYEDTSERLPGLRYLLMQAIEGQLLPDYIESCGGDRTRIEAVADGFAQIWESLGRLRAAHGDMKATNFIVGAEGRLHLFDLDAFQFGLKPARYQRGREKDLRRFMKNWADRPELLELFEAKVREVCE